MYYICNLKHISCKFHKRKDVIYAVRGTAHTLFPVDGLCLCMTYPINGRAVTRAKSKRRVRFKVRLLERDRDNMQRITITSTPQQMPTKTAFSSAQVNSGTAYLSPSVPRTAYYPLPRTAYYLLRPPWTPTLLANHCLVFIP